MFQWNHAAPTAARSPATQVKLKNCTACRLVKYCGVDCQRAHRGQHRGPCKKRAAELKDERLYTQGQERPEEDYCPICTLLISLPMENHSHTFVCCVKRVCHGCILATAKTGMIDCPFCRTPAGGDKLAMVRKRVDAKDPAAIKFLGNQYYHGNSGVKKDVMRAIELWTEAAELGSTGAHFDSEINIPTGLEWRRTKQRPIDILRRPQCKGTFRRGTISAVLRLRRET